MNKALTILFASLFTFTAYSQSNFGKIQGKVTDAKTKAPVAYATILLEKGGIRKGGAYTNDEGKYVINALDPGDYTVTVKYLDYADKVVNGVEVTANSTKYLNIEMSQGEDGGEIRLRISFILVQQYVAPKQQSESKVNPEPFVSNVTIENEWVEKKNLQGATYYYNNATNNNNNIITK